MTTAGPTPSPRGFVVRDPAAVEETLARIPEPNELGRPDPVARRPSDR